MNRILVAASMLIWIIALSAGAATSIVAPTGDDRVGDGSAGRPWATLSHAATCAKAGDTIVFHIEAEDTKGQVASTDMYTATVRPWETFSAYGYHPVMAPHAYPGAALLNVLGAAWELHTRREAMPKDKFNTESEKIGKVLEGPPEQ